MSACQGARDTIKNRLYPKEGDGGWAQDSAFVASRPGLVYRVIEKNGQQYIMPITTLAGGSRPLRLSERGWKALDSATMWENKLVTPMREGRAESPVKMQRGMWENPTYPLDTARACAGSQVPIGQVTLPAGVSFVVANYKAPSNIVTLDAGVLQQAIDQVPTLVTPTLGVPAAVLARYRRSVHQIGRPDRAPSILLQYDDPDPVLDTGSVRGKRPRNLIVVMDKGVYGYHPSWVYATTKMKGDRTPLKFLDAFDVTGDGIPELFFTLDVDRGREWTFQYRQWNDTWRESWHHSEGRCDF